MSPFVLVLWQFTVGDREGYYPGKASLGEVQGRGPVRPLGALEQGGDVLPPTVLED